MRNTSVLEVAQKIEVVGCLYRLVIDDHCIVISQKSSDSFIYFHSNQNQKIF